MNMFKIIQRFMEKETNLFNAMNATDHNLNNESVSPFHIEGSIWTHTMCVCTMAQHYDYPIEVKFAALLHDVGKAFTRSENKKADGTTRVSFTGHDGESFYRVIDILHHYEDVLTLEQRTTIEKLVAMHSSLYSWGNGSNIAAEFAGGGNFLELLKQLAHCDAGGRIALEPSASDAFVSLECELDDDPYKSKMVTAEYSPSSPTLTLLVGPPCVGKTTWLLTNDLLPSDNREVISRDGIVMAMAGTIDYAKAWEIVDHKEVDGELNNQFQRAISAGKDIVIDMPNVVRKRRRRFVRPARQKGYITRAVVFHVGLSVQDEREVERARTTTKSIPVDARERMRQGFLYPTYDDFDIIEVVR